ncbi:MAG: hypothetical protein IPP48_01240 [Chitinophagaceae bacterium]|nr:hypothetical protein [Chitinophagaceae bacterium]
MGNEQVLNSAILKTTLMINDNYPELAKFIGEMPVTIPNSSNPEINVKALSDYNESLNVLVKKYAKVHQEEAKRNF